MHAVAGGRAARTQAESGNDLVEDQERPVARAMLAQGGEEPGALEKQAVVCGHGLNNDCGDAAAFPVEERSQGVVVVEWQHARLRCARFGHTQ